MNKGENFMELNQLQKDYVKKILYINTGGSDTKILKSSIITFTESHGLVFKKNITKGDLLDLIFLNGLEQELYDKFANRVDVPYWDAAKLNEITYKQLSDLDQLGVIKALDYTGWKDCTLYPLAALGFAPGELLEIWNNKNKTDFFRTRIETENLEDVQKLINELSKLFEIENVSKPYPHIEKSSGYYIYLSIRSLNGSIINDDYKNQENAKLKLVNSTLKGTIEELNSKISKIESDSRETEYYKELKERFNAQKEKVLEAEISSYNIRHLNDVIENCKKQIAGLEEKLKSAPTGGRPEKFTDQEKETMKMYRLQGKSIRKIAEIFECSAGLVHKIINE